MAATPDELSVDPARVHLRVCADEAYPTIGAALAAAPDGAVIDICPGEYHEHLDVVRPVQLIGAGAERTILDGDGSGRVLRMTGTSVWIEGVTIRNGLARSTSDLQPWLDPDDDGGGVKCTSGALSIARSVIRDNVADDGGGGVDGDRCSITLDDVEVLDNVADLGGGVRVSHSVVGVGFTGTITGSRLAGNRARVGAGLLQDAGRLRFGGNVVEDNVASSDGGGLWIATDDGVIADNRVVGNRAEHGGGLVVWGVVALRHNRVTGNVATWGGGGYSFGQGGFRVEHDEIRDNVVERGRCGGISLYAGDLTLAGVVLESNRAPLRGGGLCAYRGHGLIPSVSLDRTVVRDNVAALGGGLDVTAGGLRVHDSVIANNRADVGGGILTGWTTRAVELHDSRFEGNQATREAGAVFSALANLDVRNVRFTGNHAARGGALWLSGEVATEETHCWSCPHIADVRVEQVTFDDNVADSGSAIAIEGHRLTVRGAILTTAAGGPQVAVLGPSAAVTWEYNDTWPSTFAGMPDPTGADGNLAADPLFTHDVHLLPGSPCVDAGPPGVLDPDGTRADMGVWGGG